MAINNKTVRMKTFLITVGIIAIILTIVFLIVGVKVVSTVVVYVVGAIALIAVIGFIVYYARKWFGKPSGSEE